MVKIMKTHISSIAIIVSLMTLCVVRFFINDLSQTSIWVSFINYAGIPIATYGVYSRIHSYCSNIVKGVFVIIFCIMAIIGALVLANIIIPSTKANDIILLVTLLISLPADFYCKLFVKNN